jgi:hypothetical protein
MSLAVLAVILFFVLYGGPAVFPHAATKVGGLVERVFIGLVLAWMLAVSAAMFRRAGPRVSPRPTAARSRFQASQAWTLGFSAGMTSALGRNSFSSLSHTVQIETSFGKSLNFTDRSFQVGLLLAAVARALSIASSWRS